MMSSVLRSTRLSAVRLAAALALAFGAAACSSGQTTQSLAAGEAATPGSARDFALNVGDRVFFDSDSTELTPTAVTTLDRQAQWLTRYPRHTFLLEGHADERGTREYNFSLGASRSQVVRDYLASRGIAPARMRTVSYGKERPVAVCNDISCWSQNRRAVTVIDGAAGM
jgi:peptidoglycan-associated lipoprotein